MKDKEILEGDKLIAEFMDGIYESDLFPIGSTQIWLPYHNITEIANLKYHSSMDWLMPVIHKISQLPLRTPVHIKMVQLKREAYCRIESSSTGFRNALFNNYANLTEVTFATVVAFIKWYNTLDKTSPLFKQPKK